MCALLLLPALAIAAVSGGISISGPSQTAVADIPPDYLLLYEEAGLGFEVPWQVLAGIGKVECDHGRDPDPACWKQEVENAAGAGGPMQFLASTWQTYGISASGGVPDRWNPADAIVSAANFLKQNGAADNNIPAAVFAYNHSQAYVQQVLAWATLYTSVYGSASTPAAAGATASTPAAQAAVAFALAQLGTPYEWGGEGAGGFDCSGLVQAAFAAAGVSLPRVAQAQYDRTASNAVALDRLQPGDLVFFGASISAITHVGIVVSPGEMVDAPHSGAVVRIESYDWPDLVAATRPVGASG